MGCNCLQPRAHLRMLLLVEAVPLESELLPHATRSAAPYGTAPSAHYKARLYEGVYQRSRMGSGFQHQQIPCTDSSS